MIFTLNYSNNKIINNYFYNFYNYKMYYFYNFYKCIIIEL